jgi:hypothetical protein
LVITAGVWNNIRADVNKFGIYANLPTSGMHTGDRYDDIDDQYYFIWSGSTWGTFARGASAGSAGTSGTSGTSGQQFTWEGAWSTTGTYGIDQCVSFCGNGYISLVNNNSGNNPSLATSAWSEFVAGGSSGTSGTAGTSGVSGTSGTSALGITSGTSGVSGTSGTSGTSGPGGGGGGTGGTPFITSFAVGTLRNDYTGRVGFQFTLTSPIQVQSIGRWIVSGNSQVHGLYIYDANGGILAITYCDTSTGTPGTFLYTNLSAVLWLPPGNYTCVSQEFSGGDQWYDSNNTSVVTAAVGTFNGPAIGGGGGGGAGPYVPTNFNYA